MNQRTCSLKSALAVFKLAVLLIFSVNHSGLGQYKSNAPFAALIRHADSSSAADLNKRLISIPEYDKAFEAYFKDKNPRKKGSGYKQYLRWRNYWSYFTENGIIKSPQTLHKAYQNKIESERPESAIANWSALGPFSAAVKNDQVPGIGRLNQIAVDPTNANVWYVGAPAGGLWKSTDAGLSWVPIFDQYPQIGVSGIAIDQVDSNIIYIATGDDDALESYSIGVMKSTDGGQTFSETGLNIENTNRGTALNEIFIDPEDRNTIWVAGTQGLYRSSNAAQTFTKVIDDEVTDFRLKPGDSKTIYALSTTTFYRSTNGGTTFSQNTTNPASILPRSYMRGVMDVSPANPDILYLLYAKNSDGSLEGLYRSTDSGVSFTKMSVTVREQKTGSDGNPYTDIQSNYNIMESNQAWFDLALAIDPEDANTLYAGCLNIWKSSDGGSSFNKLNNWYDANEAYTHADIHTLKFFDGALFAATDGGLYRSTDGGTSFVDYSNNGIATGQFYRIGITQRDSSKIVGGTQDNSGFIRLDGNWHLYTAGDGMDYEIDPNSPAISYGFAQRGIALFRSKNDGQGLDIFWEPSNEEGKWITPLTISGESKVYAGYRSVYILGPNGLYKRSSQLTSGGLDILEASISEPSILWGGEGNRLFFSSDKGFTFNNVKIFQNSITDLVIDEQNPSISYIVISKRINMDYIDFKDDDNFEDSGNVYKVEILENGEIDLTDLTKDIPQDQALFSIELNELDPNKSIFIGTSLGVYRTDNQMQTWERFDNGLPNIAVSDLEINSSKGLIVASTYGRGVFISNTEAFPPKYDLSIQTLDNLGPIIAKKGESVDLKAQIKNNGTQTIDSLKYSISINSLIRNYKKYINLSPRDSIEIIIPEIEIQDTGYNSIKLSISNREDQDKSNNSKTADIVASYDIHQTSSNSKDNNLIPYDDNGGKGSWIYTDYSGEISENLDDKEIKYKIYKTSPNERNYPHNERSYLLTPFYNLSQYEHPILSFNMAFLLEPNFDILNIEYSQDRGKTWENLGSVNSKPNWYNSENSDCQYCLENQWTGVTLIDDEKNAPRPDENILKNYQYDFIQNLDIDESLPDFDKEVILRVVFQSDELVNYSGVAINNLQVLDLNYQAPPAEEETFQIPSSAFAVSATDSTCPDSNTGIIKVELQASAPAGNYTATLQTHGSVVGLSQVLSPNAQFSALAAGVYTLCITTDQSSSFKRCYTIDVKEPQGLEVQSFVNSQTKQLTLNLNGSTTYTIVLNGKTIITSGQQLILALDRIENTIQVRGDNDCQGLFEETLILSNEIFVYPNPVDDGNVNIYLGNTESSKVRVSLHDRSGNLLFEKVKPLFSKMTQLSVKGLTPGLYFLSITDEAVAETTTHKVIIR